MKDKNGNDVMEGDFVDVLSINEDGLKHLEPEYAKDIRDAVGQKLEVNFIDEHDRAWVDIVRKSNDEEVCDQTLFLKSNQILKV